MAKTSVRQQQSQVIPLPLPPSQRFLPYLLLLFVGSGCAALIYEIVWFQLIELVIGSSAVSLGVLLGTFMGGVPLGAWLVSARGGRWAGLIRAYAIVELVIGATALVFDPMFVC